MIPFHFWDVDNFYENRAVVQGKPSDPQADGFGLIDPEGNFVVEPIPLCDSLRPLGGGVWEVSLGTERRLVDVAGHILWVDT